MKKFKEDLQRYKELYNSTDKKAVKAYALTAQEFFGIMEDMKEKAKTADKESALFYSINDAHEVGFIRGVRYAENRRKRSGSNKTGAEPAGSEQIRGADPEAARQYFILIHDYDGATISDDAYIGTRTEAGAKGIRRADQLGGRSYTIAEPVHPVYSMKEWQRDVNFSAYAGQEVTEDIYRHMYNSLLPLDLTEERAAEIRNRYGAEIETGFLMAEPYGQNANGLTYLCFGRSGGKCYFFGEVNR